MDPKKLCDLLPKPTQPVKGKTQITNPLLLAPNPVLFLFQPVVVPRMTNMSSLMAQEVTVRQQHVPSKCPWRAVSPAGHGTIPVCVARWLETPIKIATYWTLNENFERPDFGHL